MILKPRFQRILIILAMKLLTSQLYKTVNLWGLPWICGEQKNVKTVKEWNPWTLKPWKSGTPCIWTFFDNEQLNIIVCIKYRCCFHQVVVSRWGGWKRFTYCKRKVYSDFWAFSVHYVLLLEEAHGPHVTHCF